MERKLASVQIIEDIIPIPGADRVEFRKTVGLKDKNGKDIHEGDILKFLFQTKVTISTMVEHFNPGWEIWEIKYIAPSFVYIIHSQNNSYYGELPAKPRVISLHYLYAIEIIGNVDKNPELLNG